VLLVVACGGGGGVDEDAGRAGDAGPRVDAGERADGGEEPPEDAGTADAGRDVDSRLFNLALGEADPRWASIPASVSRVRLSAAFTFEAVVADAGSVRLSVGEESTVDAEAPYLLGEESWEPSVGTHELVVEAYASSDGSGETIASRTFAFEITDAGMDPTPDEGEHAVHRLWVTASGQYVTREEDGDFVNPEGEVVLASGDVSLVEMGEGQHHWVSRDGVEDSIRFAFLVLLPDGFDPEVAYPVVVFLHHGWDRYRGTDNDGMMLSTPLFAGPNALTSSAMRHRFPAIVFVPQMVGVRSEGDVRHEWAAFTNIDGETGNATSAEEPSSNAALAWGALDALVAHRLSIEGATPTVEPSRVYVTGHSMGGLGTWDWLPRRPDFFAAGVPMAGFPDHAKAPALVDMPIWAFHHEIDCYNTVEGTTTMVERIEAAGGERIRFTRLSFDTDGACDQAHFRTPEGAWNDTEGVLDWLFANVSTAFR